MQFRLYSKLMQKYINLSDVAQLRTQLIKSSCQTEGKQNFHGSNRSYNSGDKYQELTKELGLFEGAGLSTLMDISMSSIRDRPLDKKGGHSIETNLLEK